MSGLQDASTPLGDRSPSGVEGAAKRVAVISAGLSQPSSTRLLADRLAGATVRALAEQGLAATTDVFELRDLAKDVTNNLVTGFPSPRLEEVVQRVTTADGLIAVTPIFTTSYSGLFKSFVDVLDPGSLIDQPVLLGATGGSERHSLAIDYAMRPLFTYLHAAPVSTGVFAAASDWGNATTTPAARSTSAADGLHDRIDRAGRELARAIAGSTRDTSARDPFALPEGFSAVGAYGETR